jgi:hypothetical protein
MYRARLVLCVLAPFAAGYFLSHVFRSIKALIAGDLSAELGLSAADLGLLTSMYFLVFAAVLLPCGVLLDRYGPRLVNSALFLVAAAGSLVFALADGVVMLLLGRALIGLGVAVGLIADDIVAAEDARALAQIEVAPAPSGSRGCRSARGGARDRTTRRRPTPDPPLRRAIPPMPLLPRPSSSAAQSHASFSCEMMRPSFAPARRRFLLWLGALARLRPCALLRVQRCCLRRAVGSIGFRHLRSQL